MSDLDHEVLKNYRPISSLPLRGKKIEGIVAMQLKSHLVINDLHTATQSVYHANHSTKIVSLFQCLIMMMLLSWSGLTDRLPSTPLIVVSSYKSNDCLPVLV